MSVRIILVRTPGPALSGRGRDPQAIYFSVQSRWMWRGEASVKAGSAARRLFLALVASAPSVLSRREAVDILYAGDPRGGPINADKMVDVAVYETRLIGAALGVAIDTITTRGWSARPLRRYTEAEAAE